MYPDRACPKCHSSEVARVPGRAGAYGVGNNMMTGASVFSAVPVSRYVCLRCGFTEEWVDSAEDLLKIRKKFGM